MRTVSRLQPPWKAEDRLVSKDSNKHVVLGEERQDDRPISKQCSTHSTIVFFSIVRNNITLLALFRNLHPFNSMDD